MNERFLSLIAQMVPEAALTEQAQSDLSVLYQRLLETNRAVNITSILEECAVAVKHFADSLSLYQAKEFAAAVKMGKSVCDIGCGGGFPGVPLALSNRFFPISMIDSTDKKIIALQQTLNALGLGAAEAVWGRGEELASGKDGKYRAKFDICVSRAVARLNVLCELCLPFVKRGGFFIAMKGAKAKEELDECEKAISALGGKLVRLQKADFHAEEIDYSAFSAEEKGEIAEFLAAERYFVVIQKDKETSPQYPRTWAQIKKKPL